jgi:TRAP-type mannitol/chloroaromatic compound transport system permease large subunit
MPATPRPISGTTISKTTRPTLDTGLGDSIGTAAEEFVLLGTADKIPPITTENNGVGATGNNSALAMALADRRRRTSLVLQRRTATATTTAMGTVVGEGDGGGISARTSSISGGTFGGSVFYLEILMDCQMANKNFFCPTNYFDGMPIKFRYL